MSVSGGVTERFGSGSPSITMTTGAALTAGRLVEISASRTVIHAQANSLKVLGVAKQTSDAVGDKVAVATGGVWNLTASGAIAAGDQIRAGAAGVAVAIAADGDPRLVVGIALEAAADTAQVPVLLKVG
jgi:hypothetical protein